MSRILVAWFQYSINGGINRFINLAPALRRSGHEVGFTSLTNVTTTEWPEFPGEILTFAQASEREWDAVMIPGAGARKAQLEMLARLRDQRFGLRVQHVLSDPSRIARFVHVNNVLQPDIVVFNNSQWRPGDFAALEHGAKYIVPGAVDTDVFRPGPRLRAPLSPSHWALGAYGPKNAAVLVGALAHLPENYRLRLYGGVGSEKVPSVEVPQRWGQVEHCGYLFGTRLADFYRNCDIVLTADTVAGWCNTAAEAMACGIPCIVSPRGTVDFALDQANCLVLNDITSEEMAKQILRMTADPNLMAALGAAAAETMARFDWPQYATQMLAVMSNGGNLDQGSIPVRRAPR